MEFSERAPSIVTRFGLILLTLLWCCLQAIVFTVYHIVRFIGKAYRNCGVHGHSKILSFICWFGYVVYLNIFRIFYRFYELLPNRQVDSKLSFKFRSYHAFVRSPPWLKALRKYHNSIPDRIFLEFAEHIINYFMGITATIPQSANIQSLHISKRDLYSSMQNKSVIDDSLKIAEIEDKNVRKIHLLCITGNDNIQQMYDKDRNFRDTIFYIHGGGYLFGGPGHVGYVSRLSIKLNKRIIFIMYDKPVQTPKQVVKTQIDQVLCTYLYLMYCCGIPANKLIVAGESAGGGLAMLLISNISKYIQTIQNNTSLSSLWKFPKGAILISPWVDLSMKSKSWIKNRDFDVIAEYSYAKRISKMLYSEAPYRTNVFADCTIISCSILLFVSKDENLYDDSVNLVKKIKRDNGNNVDLTVIEKDDLMHAWPFFITSFPEAMEAIDVMVEYVDKWLDSEDYSSE